MTRTRSCWCGNTTLGTFSLGYLHCDVCETLVAAQMPIGQDLLLENDGRDFYGNYFFDQLSKGLKQTSLQERARSDLAERYFYRLRELLKFKRPPARVLELGSAHGVFVAIMQWAGFDASGLDLSPGLCQFARQTFNVPILTGPVESQEIPLESLDVIALLDVLEHLPDPVGTMRHCASLLKPDGFFFLKTAKYPEGKTLEEMESEDDPFLEQLIPDQHLYLFSRSSDALFFQRLGFKHVDFEPAIFPDSHATIVAGRRPIVMLEQEASVPLEAQVSSHSTFALLDLGNKFQNLGNKFQKFNAHAHAVWLESEERERGLHELTAIIGARDARIVEAERMAEERLASLEAMHILAEEIRRESEKRERGLHELTAIIAARDAHVAELERVVQQQRSTQAVLSESLSKEAALRAKILEFRNETIFGFVQRKIRALKSKSDATGS
jgi:SAM-dependent methyltransferase